MDYSLLQSRIDGEDNIAFSFNGRNGNRGCGCDDRDGGRRNDCGCDDNRRKNDCGCGCGNTGTRRCRDRNDNDCEKEHVHEIVGSTQIVGCCDDAHNHRFATVSGEAIPMGCDDHVHEVCFRTDFTDGHYHEFKGKTCGAINVGGGRHVHFLEAQTEEADGHRHCFRVATLIEDPIGKCECEE